MTLAEHLAELEAAQLVRQLLDPELAYAFKNILVQETAYASLLIRHRRELHHQVARCIEELYAHSGEELAPLLAYHFAKAGDDPLATLKYARLAGDAALRRYAHVEAIQHYDAALAAALAVSDGTDTELLHLYASRGRAYELSGGYSQALANYAEMIKTAHRRKDRQLELAALTATATVRATPNPTFNSNETHILCDRALALARQIGDRAAEAKVFWILLLANYFAANPAQSVVYGERAVSLARELDLTEQLAFALNDIHRSYNALGDQKRALAALEEAEGLWRRLGNLPMLADNLNGGAEIRLMSGEFDSALALTAEADTINRMIGNTWQQSYGGMLRAVVHLERGDIDQGVADAEVSMRLAASSGFGIPLIFLPLQLALAYAGLGAFDRATVLAHQAIAAVESGLLFTRPYVLAATSLIFLQQGDLAAAESMFREAGAMPSFDAHLVASAAQGAPAFWLAAGGLQLQRGQHAAALATAEELLTGLGTFHIRSGLPDALYLKGQALIGLGQPGEARRILEDARVEAVRLGARRVLWHILECLADLVEEDAAEELRLQARAAVEYIAAHTSSEKLRASLLGLPSTARCAANAGAR